jgi:hypothetical protein
MTFIPITTVHVSDLVIRMEDHTLLGNPIMFRFDDVVERGVDLKALALTIQRIPGPFGVWALLDEPWSDIRRDLRCVDLHKGGRFDLEVFDGFVRMYLRHSPHRLTPPVLLVGIIRRFRAALGDWLDVGRAGVALCNHKGEPIDVMEA